MEISFVVTASEQDWDKTMGGWRCSALRIPGAKVDSIYYSGKKADDAWYKIKPGVDMIHWIRDDEPKQIAITISIAEELSPKYLTDKWKRLAKLLPFLTTILSSVITGLFSYYFLNKEPDIVIPVDPGPKTEIVSTEQGNSKINGGKSIDPGQNVKPDKPWPGLTTIRENQEICEITNPLSEKDIIWDKDYFVIEGRADQTEAVWIAVKPLNENNKVCSVREASIDSNRLWRASIQLSASDDNSDKLYKVIIYPGNDYNRWFFNKILKQKPDSKNCYKLMEGEPDSACQSIMIKRVAN